MTPQELMQAAQDQEAVQQIINHAIGLFKEKGAPQELAAELSSNALEASSLILRQQLRLQRYLIREKVEEKKSLIVKP